MFKYLKYIFLSAIILAGGCKSTQIVDEEKLPFALPEQWGNGKNNDQKQFLDNWLTDFNNPALDKLVAESLEKNFDLKSAEARLDSATALLTIAGADRLPQINGSLGGSRQKRTSTGGFIISNPISDNFNLSGIFTWELDLWGRLKDRRVAALADLFAAKEDFQGLKLSLAANTAKLWFDIIEAGQQLKLSKKTLESFESNLNILQERFERGISETLDLRLTRANVATAKSNVFRRQRLLDELVRSLEILLGRYPKNQLNFNNDIPKIKRNVPAGLPIQLLKRRPDIAAAENRVIASHKRINESRKALLPGISLNASGGTSSSNLSDLLDKNFKVWSLAGNVTQPFFQGRRLKANIKRSEAVKKEAVANFHKTVLTAYSEVENSLANESLLENEESALKENVKESRAAEELSWDRYQSGLTDIITVLEAQRRSFNAQSNLLQVSNLRLQNRVNLYLALGGGF